MVLKGPLIYYVKKLLSTYIRHECTLIALHVNALKKKEITSFFILSLALSALLHYAAEHWQGSSNDYFIFL